MCMYIYIYIPYKYYLYIYVYENCSTTLDESLRKDIRKKSRRDGEI